MHRIIVAIAIAASVIAPLPSLCTEVLECDVRAFIGRSYGLSIHFAEAGPVARAVRTMELPSIEYVVCTPEAPAVVLARIVGMSAECWQAEDPSSGPEALTQQAADEVQVWLRSLPAEKLRLVDGTLQPDVVNEAEARHAAALKRLGFEDKLVQAWRRHVVGASDCSRTMQGLMEGMKAELAVSIDCGRLAWDRIVDLCTIPSPSVLGHIVIRKSVLPIPERQLAALDRLVDRGLVFCLANLVERHGSSELQDAIKRFDLNSEAGEHERLVQAAWAIWRAHGVEGWLDATMEAGELPENVASALQECAGSVNVRVGAPAPAIKAFTRQHEPWSLVGPPHRFALVSFWASWCEPCRQEMEDLSRAVNEWNRVQSDAGKHLVYIAINADDKPEDVRETLDVPDFRSVTFVFDLESATTRDWGVRGLPATFLIDPAGQVLEAVLGYDPTLAERVLALVRQAGGG